MPIDHSTELDLIFWEEFLYKTSMLVPQGKDSWQCHALDVLNLYCAGGEL